MCGFADFRKDFCGFFRIFGKVYEDFWSDTPLGSLSLPFMYISSIILQLNIQYQTPRLCK